MQSNCKHEFQLETVGGTYLTGAYVCTRCSYRVSMSHEQFHQHSYYPRHYQAIDVTSQLESDEEETSTTLRDDRHRSNHST